MNELGTRNLNNLKPIEMGKQQKEPKEILERIKQANISMYRTPVVPKTGTYAEVIVNDQTVAKVSKSGGVTTSNAMGGAFNDLLASLNGQGPELAQQANEQIAAAIGGEVVMSPTAKTQTEWINREPVTWKVNDEQLQQHGYDVSKELENLRFSSAKLANETLGTLLDYSEVKSKIHTYTKTVQGC